jgi:hypothetical protein
MSDDELGKTIDRVTLQGEWSDVNESLSQNYPPKYSAIVGDLIASREGILKIVTLKMCDGSVKTFWSRGDCGRVDYNHA